MHLTIPLPVLFSTRTPKTDEIKTALVFVPTDFELAESDEGTARLVAVDFDRNGSIQTQFRLTEEGLFARSAPIVDPGVTVERLVWDIERDVHKAVSEGIVARLASTRVDVMYPKDAREIANLAVAGNEEYVRYLQRAHERAGMRSQTGAVENGLDFEEAKARSITLAMGVLARNMLVDGKRFRKSEGLVLQVECGYNRTTVMSVYGMGNGFNWNRKTGDATPNAQDVQQYFFALSERDEATEFARDLAYRMGERLVLKEDDDLQFLVSEDELPEIDMRWAELVRSSKDTCSMVGREIARRIRNQEHSIFTDDRKLRYAFDALSDILDTVDAFGQPDERLEAAANRLLDAVFADTQDIDARYRNLARNYAKGFEHLHNSLRRWEDRPMGVDLDIGGFSDVRPR